jgi:hypothetical protein
VWPVGTSDQYEPDPSVLMVDSDNYTGPRIIETCHDGLIFSNKD